MDRFPSFARAALVASLFSCFTAFSLQAAPVDLQLWARGVISLYDQDGEVFSGPEDWGTDSPYNWITLAWKGKQASWTIIGEVGSDGWTDSSLRNIDFQYRFFEGQLKFTFGKPFIDHYTMHSYIEWLAYGSRLFDKEYGFLAEYTPLAGLWLAGGCAVPVNTDQAHDPASDVYRNFRFAASYEVERWGKFIVGYINGHDSDIITDLDGHELMASANLKLIAPATLMLGYQGFFTADGEQNLFAASVIPVGAFRFTVDLKGSFAPDFAYETRGEISYPVNTLTFGAQAWWLSSSDHTGETGAELGAMPFASANIENGYIRLGFKYAVVRESGAVYWSVPLTYDMWF